MSELGLPPLATAPPPSIREQISSEDWVASLDAWIIAIEARLQLSQENFEKLAIKDAEVKPFLVSYLHYATPPSIGSTARTLRRLCFLLGRRLLLAHGAVSEKFLDYQFLGKFCMAYGRSPALKPLLQDIWQQSSQSFALSIEKGKSQVVRQLRRDCLVSDAETVADLHQLSLLAFILPQVGSVIMAGSDYIDTMFETYQNQGTNFLRGAIVANIYAALSSLMAMSPPAVSLLLDQLFSLKAAAEVDAKSPKCAPNLLSDLVCTTSLLSRMERLFSTIPQKRAEILISSLHSYRNQSQKLHPYCRHRRTERKGKQRVVDALDTDIAHTHRISLVTQIHDLFPDLGFEYVVKLLDYYAGDAETVISHLLEGTLPTQLEPTKCANVPDAQSSIPSDALDPSLPARSNKFDDDDFDRLAVSPSKIHFGRSHIDESADDLLADRSNRSVNKAAIMSALAAFDSDDDEHDDTYDVADVGGTVDSVPLGPEVDPVTEETKRARGGLDVRAELMLFNLYKSNPDLFKRDGATRRSSQRDSLRKDTGLTDEIIEGWAVMLSREPKRIARLDRVLSTGHPSSAQPVSQTGFHVGHLTRTIEEGDATRSTPASSASFPGGGDPHREGILQGRSTAGSRAQHGASSNRNDMNTNVSGAKEQDAARSRRTKETRKASRANHNRRDQRAKKMASAGL